MSESERDSNKHLQFNDSPDKGKLQIALRQRCILYCSHSMKV